MFNKVVHAVLLGIVISIGFIVAVVSQTQAATFQTPDLRAFFETTLASRIASTDTSFTLTSATDFDGNALASSTYGFIIDEGTASEEIVLADCTGTACTNATRGISGLTGTTTVSALRKEHRRGASVKMTDAPALLFLTNVFKGRQVIESPLRYTTTVSTSTLALNDQNLASVAYANSLSFGGVGGASETAVGFVELATNAELGSTTLTGASGGRLAVSTAVATSVKPTSGHYAIVTNSSGELDSTFTSSILPIGTVLPYASSTAPTGFLAADGTAVSRTTYSNLFNILGTTYGVGNGTSTFNLPDLKARIPVGYAAAAPTTTWTFASRSSNVITVTGANNATSSSLQTGQRVVYSAPAGAMTGLTNGNTYYLIRVAYNQFSLATDVRTANSGEAIALSSDGTGTQIFTVTYSARPMGETGGTETQTTVPTHNHTTDATYEGGGSGSGGTGGGDDQTGTISNTGSDTPNNIPLYTVLNYIIKY